MSNAAWSIDEGPYGPRMTLKGPWGPEVLATIRASQIRDLELNYAKGWRGANVAFLADLEDQLEAFTIIDFLINDVDQVNLLKKLRYLDVNTYCRTELRFSSFPSLEECSIEWRPKAASIFSHRGIKKLFINKLPRKDMTSFVDMRELGSLSLASPGIETMRGVDALKNLKFIGIYVARQLASLSGLEALKMLEHVEINDCPRIKNVSPLRALSGLRRLHLCNDNGIETLKPLEVLRDLEEVLFYESTNVLDGDLSPLAQLPKLRSVAFMDRSHYSHRSSDLLKR